MLQALVSSRAFRVIVTHSVNRLFLHILSFHDIFHTACEFLEFPSLIMLSSLEFALGAVVSSFMLLAVSCCVRWVFTLDFRTASKHVDKV